MRIAVIGTGISGMLAARLLASEHELSVFEAGDYVGGHTNTVTVDLEGESYPLDTGFMVFNDRTYPNFVRMLDLLRVPWRNSDMSFSVRRERTGLEWGRETACWKSAAAGVGSHCTPRGATAAGSPPRLSRGNSTSGPGDALGRPGCKTASLC